MIGVLSKADDTAVNVEIGAIDDAVNNGDDKTVDTVAEDAVE